MTIPYNIINYLSAAIIVLLLTVLVVLVRRLKQAANRQKALEEEIAQLRAQKTENAIGEIDERAQNQDMTKIAIEQLEQLPENVFVAHIDQLIMRNIGKSELSANTVAQVMHLSRTQLDRRLKQYVGQSATAYLLNRRMTYARELLLTTDMPIAEVATACGFEDTSYFTRVFRNYYDVTPSEARKSNDMN